MSKSHIQNMCDTLDRVIVLLNKWKKDETVNRDYIIELDEALSNCIDDRDIYDWLTQKTTTAFHFYLNKSNTKEVIQ